jgi:uncharacterized protein (DUF58 family)
MANNKNNLNIKSRKRIFSHLIGEHNSFFSGTGLDFKELREYSSGDDIRHINWKVTAKSMTPAVNIYNEDKQLNIVLVYLNSGSIHFGSHRSKQDTMIEILANLGYATTQKNDMLTTVFFSNKEDKFYKPSKHSKIVDLQIQTAQNLKHLGKDIDYKKLNNYLLSKIKQKSLIFIIGDFLDICDFKLLSAKHEVNCIIVRDRFEEDLKLLGEFNFIDTNSSDSENIFLDEHSINEYNKLLKTQDNQLFFSLKKANIRFKKIYTDDNILLKLTQLVKG